MAKIEMKKPELKSKYQIGENYLIELNTNSMLYYKKRGDGIWNIIRAKSVDWSFGNKELLELAEKLAKDLKMELK